MESILSIRLNKDNSQFCIATTSGYKIFSLYPPALLYQQTDGDFRLVQIYQDSPLLALVGAGQTPRYSPRRLVIWNKIQRTAICETSFSDTILSVRLNRVRIVAVLADSIHLYFTNTMKRQKTIRTQHNPKGLVALSPAYSDCYLLYPGSISSGILKIVDCFNERQLPEINAHSSPLACIEVNGNGKFAATASEKGTVIRVWSIQNQEKIFTFKRGLMNVQTHTLCFSENSEMLISCSDSGTVHVYLLKEERVQSLDWKETIRDSFFSALSYITPSAYSDSLERSRSFITARTGFREKFIACLVPGTSMLCTISFSGRFQFFRVDFEAGGEGEIVFGGNILDMHEDNV